MTHHIHIFGASGSGTSTLGGALADALPARHLDTDDYYWVPTDPPYQRKRAPADRIARILEDAAQAPNWVLSGSICSWGDPLLSHFTLAIFLRLDPTIRIARLRAREQQRYGSRIEPGGDLHAHHIEFIEWARRYDEGKLPLRSLDMHEQWMTRLECPVLRLDSERSAIELARDVMDRIEHA